MRWDGEAPPTATDLHLVIGQCYRMLADANSAIDWSALPLALQLYGGADQIEAVVEGLITYKHHRPPGGGHGAGRAQPDGAADFDDDAPGV